MNAVRMVLLALLTRSFPKGARAGVAALVAEHAIKNKFAIDDALDVGAVRGNLRF